MMDSALLETSRLCHQGRELAAAVSHFSCNTRAGGLLRRLL
ncbi:hypothetical protein M3J09_012280 [Ascochyta lentis]